MNTNIDISSWKNSKYYKDAIDKFGNINVKRIIDLPYTKNPCGIYHATEMIYKINKKIKNIEDIIEEIKLLPQCKTFDDFIYICEAIEIDYDDAIKSSEFAKAKTGDCVRFLTMAMHGDKLAYIKSFTKYGLVNNGMAYYKAMQYATKYGDDFVREVLMNEKITKILHVEILGNLVQKYNKDIVINALSSIKVKSVFDIANFIIKSIDNEANCNNTK